MASYTEQNRPRFKKIFLKSCIQSTDQVTVELFTAGQQLITRSNTRDIGILFEEMHNSDTLLETQKDSVVFTNKTNVCTG